MLISDVFRNGRSLMFFNAFIQVSACVAHIIRITQITLKVIFIGRSILYILLKSFVLLLSSPFFCFHHLPFVMLGTCFIAFLILTCDFTSCFIPLFLYLKNKLMISARSKHCRILLLVFILKFRRNYLWTYFPWNIIMMTGYQFNLLMVQMVMTLNTLKLKIQSQDQDIHVAKWFWNSWMKRGHCNVL